MGKRTVDETRKSADAKPTSDAGQASLVVARQLSMFDDCYVETRQLEPESSVGRPESSISCNFEPALKAKTDENSVAAEPAAALDEPVLPPTSAPAKSTTIISVLKIDKAKPSEKPELQEAVAGDTETAAVEFPADSPVEFNISTQPHWPLIRLGDIEMHPLLPELYKKQGIEFPPLPPHNYLTPKGIRVLERFLPIQLVASSGRKFECFSGVRLWLAALNTLPLDALVNALVYSSIRESQLVEAVEIELDILYIWHRQTRNERRVQDLQYLQSKHSTGTGLRSLCAGI